jgi:hypothetical protein
MLVLLSVIYAGCAECRNAECLVVLRLVNFFIDFKNIHPSVNFQSNQ